MPTPGSIAWCLLNGHGREGLAVPLDPTPSVSASTGRSALEHAYE